MRKVLKLVGIVLGVLVVVIVAAAILVPFFVDPNDYRDEIEQVVKDKTGRDLVIGGDIDLTVFPWLGVELGQVKLSNAPGFGDQPFVQVGSVEVSVKLMPLALRREVEISTITLDGLQLNLARDAAGRGNWEDLVAAGTGEEPGKPPKKEDEAKAAAAPVAALAVGGLKIHEAQVVWDDRSTGVRYAVQRLNMDTGSFSPGEPVDVQLAFDVESSKPAVQAHVTLTGETLLAKDFQSFRGDDLRLGVEATSSELPAEEVKLALSADVDADMTRQSVTVSGLKLTVNAKGKELPAESVEAELTTQLTADLAKQIFKAADLQLSVEGSGGQLPGGKLEAKLTTAVVADLGRQTLAVDNLDLEAAGIKATANLQGSHIIDAPAFSGRLQVNEFSPRALLKDMGQDVPETSDAKVLTRVSFATDLAGTQNSVELNNLALILDDTTLKGNLAVADLSKQALRFDLTVDAIDADRYLPPPKEGEETKVATPATAAAAGAGILPVDTLRALDINGILRVGQLKVSNLKVNNVRFSVNAKDGLLRMHPATADLYQGNYSGDMQLDVRSTAPTIGINERLQGIQAGPLLADLTGKDKLTGRGDVSARLTARGNDVDAWRSSLDGNLAFSFANGAVKGFNLAQLIREAKARLKGQPVPPSDQPNQTDFTELKGTATVNDGVVTNRDLLAKSPYLRVTGDGTVDLPRERLDYGVTTTIVGTEKGQGGEALKDLVGLGIPIRVTGSFDNPSYKLDLEKVLTEKAKQEVKQRLSEELGKKLGGDKKPADGQQQQPQKPEDALKKQLEEGLKGLFK